MIQKVSLFKRKLKLSIWNIFTTPKLNLLIKFNHKNDINITIKIIQLHSVINLNENKIKNPNFNISTEENLKN